MWRRAFSGQNQFGFGAAIATFLFIIFVPFLIINVRRFRTEEATYGHRRRAASRSSSRRAPRRRSCAGWARRRSTSCWSAIAILWLIPTAGLFITSLLTPTDQAEGGWWNFLFEPSAWTFENYSNMFDDDSIVDALILTAQVTLGATVLPILVGVARRLRARVDRLPRARLALPHRHRAARRADPDGADPDVLALQHLQPVRHRPGPDPLPHGVRAPLRDLPVTQLLRGDPEGPDGSGTDRRRLRVPALLPRRAAARPARHRSGRDLPGPLRLERPPDRRS